jgi:hypothetical protein
MAPPGRPTHDALYHRLFSDPAVVAQLLTTFVNGPWLDDLDLDGMERLNAKFHADTGQRREGDMIWRIPRRDGEDTFLVLLLEFQSTSDQYMALRVLTYAGLLWQQLLREQRLPAGGKLPPILPVVLYNGNADWLAPVALRGLLALPGGSPLWHWQPELRYHLIETGAFSEAELEKRDGLPALWFRLEDAGDPDRLLAVADAVIAWLTRHPGFQGARAAFAALLGAKMTTFQPDVQVPADLLEVRDMGTNRLEKWLEAHQQQYLEKGLEEGLEKGRRAGEAALLLRLLERRFGALPQSVNDHVLAAQIAELDDWGLRLLDAASLGEVFGETLAARSDAL